MDEERKLLLFYAIAEMAAEHGMDLNLELKQWESGSQTLNGFLTDNSTTDHGLVLRAYHPDPAPAPEDEDQEDDQEDDQEEDDEDPGPEPYEEIDGVKYYANGEGGCDG